MKENQQAKPQESQTKKTKHYEETTRQERQEAGPHKKKADYFHVNYILLLKIIAMKLILATPHMAKHENSKKLFTIQAKMLSSKESSRQSDEQVKPRKTSKQQQENKTRSWHLQHLRSCKDPVNLLTTTTLLLVVRFPQKSATSTVRTLEVELSSATASTQHQTYAVVKAELSDSGMSLSPSGFYRSRSRIARWEFAD